MPTLFSLVLPTMSSINFSTCRYLSPELSPALADISRQNCPRDWLPSPPRDSSVTAPLATCPSNTFLHLITIIKPPVVVAPPANAMSFLLYPTLTLLLANSVALLLLFDTQFLSKSAHHTAMIFSSATWERISMLLSAAPPGWQHSECWPRFIATLLYVPLFPVIYLSNHKVYYRIVQF